ncbi:hypothetical protein [Nocardioides daeguensis]|uniref:hypothetical protein n=1 Tax=Nocardioides daeguensis TaxID=908359 RepID=UPI001C450340|nr:hypothetical protein [Nocardioides daeguensis]MBV6726565.1 hypothetical protein [Nocardioides daeguensis]MCR1772408.1 hypothetical protein [Nocardioides daeguensis]
MTTAAAALAGLTLGVAVTSGVSALREEIDSDLFRGSDPGAARWDCDDAEAVAVATLDDGIVHVLLVLTDERRRSWVLKRSPYHPRTVLEPRDDGTYPVIRVADGDTDGGFTRRVSLRADGADAWCTGTVSLVEAPDID